MAVFDDDDESLDLDDEPSTPAPDPKPAQPVIDENRLAQSIAQHLNTGRSNNQQQEVDPIVDMVSRMRSEGYKDEAITLACLTAFGVEKKLRTEFNRELKRRDGETLQRTRDREAEDTLEKAVADLVRDEPRLKYVTAAVKEAAIKKYFADNARSAKWNRGEVDKTAIVECVDGAADDTLKGLGLLKEPGRQPAANPGKGKSSEDKTTSASKSQTPYRERLEGDHQIHAFNTAKHSNQKLLGMSAEEAEKKAFEYASKIPAPKLAQRLG